MRRSPVCGVWRTDQRRIAAGIALRSWWHVAADLSSGALERVLPEVDTPPADIFALTPGAYYTPPRVTALVEYLRRELPRRITPPVQERKTP